MSAKEELANLVGAHSYHNGLYWIVEDPAGLARAAALLGARARDRQLLDEFRFHLPFDAAKIEGIMRVTKPEELL